MSYQATNLSQTSSGAASFEAFGLAAPLLDALAEAGFVRPTEIQARAIPVALQGRDLMASAQTGTGKTAAFALPALQRLLAPPRRQGRGPRVLVLTPTRELAGQVEEMIGSLGSKTRVRTGVVVGGVSYAPQQRLLRGSLDLLVATPGRLLDHIAAGLADFSRLELFVLDEADRMLDMGFIKPVQRIAAALPAERQTLLFSATLEGGVTDIAQRLLREPVQIRLASAKVRHQGIAQRLHLVDSPEHKHSVLSRLLSDPALTQAIVFTATKRGADRLAKRLKSGGHACAALHGNMRQNARQRTVDSLRSGKVQILVATDVAARGMDILGVSHVINFDLPMVPEDYIHRIGRTGRNGAFGTAISLVGPQDRVKLGAIERLTGQRLQPQDSGVPSRAVMSAAQSPRAPASKPRGESRPAPFVAALPAEARHRHHKPHAGGAAQRGAPRVEERRTVAEIPAARRSRRNRGTSRPAARNRA